MRIEFTIPWEVAPKQSARGGVRGWYQTSKIKNNAACLVSFAMEYRPEVPLEGPLRVSYVVTYPYVTRHTKRQRAAGPIPKDTSPDVDQLAKQLSDVLEAARFFRNDRQIAQLRVDTWWGAEPGVRVVVEPARTCFTASGEVE